MDPHELHTLRRQARRDSDLGSGPVRLYSEVIDLTIMDECRARYTTLAEWLGTTPRTSRRWRDRLVETGYITVKEGPPDRLVPTDPDENDESDQTEMSGKPDESVRSGGDNRTDVSGPPDSSVRSTPDESVRDIRDNTHTRKETQGERERAPAGGTGDGEASAEPTPDVSGYGPDYKGHPAVEAHREIFPAVSLGQIQREKIASTVGDLDLCRAVLEWWALNSHRPRSIARQLAKYQEDHDEQRKHRNNDRQHAASESGGRSGGGRGTGSSTGRGGNWGS